MFELDARLENDTIVLGDFIASRVLMAKDSRYPWCILVPKYAHITELYQLPDSEQQQVMRESAFLGKTLMSLFDGGSLNVAALGNVVAQLHIHHVVRFSDDPTWPGPIWGVGTAIPFEQDALERRAALITAQLSGQLGFV
ncbi:MAG: HIT domain-containing protein [Gammaproteobacteria bacterium]|nr:HIT domain-containing protein [Gammaproteobacteria bacterium]